MPTAKLILDSADGAGLEIDACVRLSDFPAAVVDSQSLDDYIGSGDRQRSSMTLAIDRASGTAQDDRSLDSNRTAVQPRSDLDHAAFLGRVDSALQGGRWLDERGIGFRVRDSGV